jgi:hypothetical protein
MNTLLPFLLPFYFFHIFSSHRGSLFLFPYIPLARHWQYRVQPQILKQITNIFCAFASCGCWNIELHGSPQGDQLAVIFYDFETI